MNDGNGMSRVFLKRILSYWMSLIRLSLASFGADFIEIEMNATGVCYESCANDFEIRIET